MENPEQVVRQFCEAVSGMDAEQLRPFFSDDVFYHNIPMEPSVGIDATIDMLAMFIGMCSSFRIDIHHLAVNGNVVLTERTDTFVMGTTEAPLPVMGTFEITDGRITAWRDYFDMAQVTAMFTSAQ